MTVLKRNLRAACRHAFGRKTLLILATLAAQFSGQAQQVLPPEVPPFEVNLNGVQEGGHLFATAVDMQNPTSDWPSTVMLTTEQGELVFYMPITDSAAAPYPRTAVGNFQLHPDGRMSFSDKLFGQEGNIYIMDSTFQVIDTLNCTPQYTLDGHDFVITDDGHYHLLAMEERIMDASSLVTESGQFGDTACVVTGHIIQEFDQNKNLVGEWKSLDHFALSDIYYYYFTNPAAVDHAHVNSLFVDFDGHYVISSRSLNEITRINRQTGQIMWRLGGKNNQFTFAGDTLPFTAQHDAQYYDDGTVVLFDNASNSIPDHVSRMLIYQMDTVNMTVFDSHNFQHPLNLPSGFMGSARTLDQNNFIISWGGGFNYSVGSSIQEFDNLWNEVMELDFEDGFTSYRALKAELPFELPRPVITCTESTQTLTTTATYESYFWSTGETTASILVSTPGTYQVWTNVGDGFMSSESIEILDANNVCAAWVGIAEASKHELEVFPIPASDQLTVKIPNNTSGQVLLQLIDMQGRAVLSKVASGTNTDVTLDVKGIATGVYHLRLTGLDADLMLTRRVSVVR
jgi:hypothetical protein